MMGRFIRRSFYNLLAPLDCAVCQQLLPEEAAQAICESCRAQIEPAGPRCSYCDCALRYTRNGEHCDQCPDRPFRFDRMVTLGGYEGPLREAVLQMKAPQHDRLAILLGDMLAERYRQSMGDQMPDVVVPAPMIWGRRLLRGVNSPDLLAMRMARALRIALALDGLEWQRICEKQSALPRTSRHENVRGALAASASYHFEGCHVLFIDDVVTTGATAREAARALLKAGARLVTVAAAARGSGE